ncbi:multidrug effflux MFS transporter [Clostridium baratii]|uniref:multidrug effflux MFS transporter n=1 Tax=Clostridium baratii TaxID=1561 RepID=UPI0029040E6B|nr:multidrug effflux MFS transporter [Clostridium baratii]MDU1054338.1 multidrug effflux MFS transporter [Clostridium baratii]
MDTKEKNDLSIKQKILRNKGFIAFIGFLSAFVPMSTDLYLPALPKMITTFHTTEQILNLTITFFFIFYAIGMLFWGPLSDKYGRKRILLIGMITYCIGSFLCACSNSVEALVISRIIQALGSGSAVSVSTAMMKDVYTGKKLTAMLALVQSIAMTTPVIAPTIGSLILKYTSWHGIFWVLSIVSILGIIGSILVTETLTNYNDGNILQVFSKLKTVSKNPGFSVLVLIFTITALPMMAYISTSSYIYIDGFHLNDQLYSYFYSSTAIFLVLGPMFYVKLSNKFKSRTIITVDFLIVLLSGILLIVFGNHSPLAFALSIIPAMFFGNMLKPPSTTLMLAQQDDNIGSASSLVSFTNTIMGSIGMILITLNVGNKIIAIGTMYVIVALISLSLWLTLSKRPFIKQVDN